MSVVVLFAALDAISLIIFKLTESCLFGLLFGIFLTVWVVTLAAYIAEKLGTDVMPIFDEAREQRKKIYAAKMNADEINSLLKTIDSKDRK